MNPQATNWVPGLLVLGGGIAVALFYVLGSRRLKDEAPAPETSDDLDARYQSILAELRTHVANKHLLPKEAFEAEKHRLELAAADVLKARALRTHETTKQQARAEKLAAAPPTFAKKNPALVGALVGGAVVAFFALLGWQLSSSATERQGGMAATGMTPPGGGGGPMQQRPQSDGKIQALAARVQSNPEDAEAVSELALQLIRRQAFEEARPLVARAMLLDPFNPRARVCQAVVKAMEGDFKSAISDLEALSTKYPEAYDGKMFAGMLAMEENDPRRALTDLEAYLALAPPTEQPPMMRMMVAQLKQELEQPSAPAP